MHNANKISIKAKSKQLVSNKTAIQLKTEH